MAFTLPPRPKPYTPANWYWIVGGDGTQVYSSARSAFAPISDATYQAWLAAGYTPTRIDTQANLDAVLFQAGVTSLQSATLLARLTAAEYTAIRQAAASQLAAGNGQLELWLDMARAAPGGVDLNDPVTIEAKASLVSSGLITQARADAVFVPG